MKQVKILIISIIILIITGCVAKEIKESDSYSFNYNGINIAISDNMKEVLTNFSNYISYQETMSCAFEGLDKIYTYEHFEISTYPKNNLDYVLSIYLLDDTVSTNEGIKINDTYDKLVATYGKEYKNEGNEYKYIKNNVSLSFIIENNHIIQIAYSLVLE